MMIAMAAALFAASFAPACSSERATSPTALPTSAPTLQQNSPTTQTSTTFRSYYDRRNRFTIEYPEGWSETSLRLLGDRDVYGAEVVGFADHAGPTTDEGCYANAIQVSILEDRPYDEAVLAALRENLSMTVERLEGKNDAVVVVEPWDELQIAGALGMKIVMSLSRNGQEFMAMDCVLIAHERFYELEFFTVKGDWAENEPLFQKIIATFTTGAS